MERRGSTLPRPPHRMKTAGIRRHAAPNSSAAPVKIVVAEKISPKAVEALRGDPRWSVVTADQLAGDLNQQLGDADALVVRSAVQVTAAVLEHAPRLRVIGRAGVGVDNIDLDAATKRG